LSKKTCVKKREWGKNETGQEEIKKAGLEWRYE
jgi:hypothetical protein